MNATDIDGHSPLSYAGENRHSEVTKFILAQDDIKVNMMDKTDVPRSHILLQMGIWK